MEIDKQTLLKILSSYSSAFVCFSAYVEWVCENVAAGLEKFDLIAILARNDQKRLTELEESLNSSCRILNLHIDKFTKTFGFLDDLLVDDVQKVHDLLAEPLLVLDLDAQGFTAIQKLPHKISVEGNVLASADFLATRNSKLYAIEVKTVRTETGVEDGVLFGDPFQSNWWGKMFFNNAVMKIEDKSQRAILQLENTKEHYHCDLKMLALVSRRLGPSTLLSESELLNELTRLKARYSEIDCFCGKLYFGNVSFCPELN